MEQIEGLVTSKEIQSFEMITLFVREVFGTFFIEEGNWTFDEKNAIIGRTYFADRKRYKKAVNHKAIANILQIYKMALTGCSTYEPEGISQAITQMYKKYLGLNIDYLMFFDDDSAPLRRRKVQMLRHLAFMVLQQINGKESIMRSNLRTGTSILESKMLMFVVAFSRGTYTEIVLQSILNSDPSYEDYRKILGDR